MMIYQHLSESKQKNALKKYLLLTKIKRLISLVDPCNPVEETMKTVKKPSNNGKVGKASKAQRLDVALARVHKRLMGIIGTCKRYDLIESHNVLVEASVRVVEAREAVQELPASWEPAKAPRGGRPLAAGDLVAIRPNRREVYEDLIASDHMDGLRVAGVVGKKVRIETIEGEYLGFVPRGHLVVSKGAA